ncbi:hypothetical protein ACIPW9_02025 [Streptomyces sp. NPDC090052]|uniref:hypothetical protein n=1 Tax=unclassified Streptomyces TaxID=2593676 RepID=UPI0022585696|nr:hypothetical protein [Streptomyces sp. NBC_01306]MCX4726714.1 hypothetical protein [Streptomyces sp. NBC_01306]
MSETPLGAARASSLRLLPWAGPEGRPCYLSTDGRGPVARLADNMEAVQLGMGTQLLGHARSLVAEQGASADEFRYLAARLTESLRDVLRVAESRGRRLRACGEEAAEADCDDL